MTLNEAIERAKEKAAELRERTCIECAVEHEQLATWLEELSKFQWIPVTKRLPETSKQYLVTVDELRWPKNTYDSVDSPTERLFVTSMHFDCTNRLWHDSDGFVINALIDPEDVLNGYVAVAWLPLPEPYKEDEHD